MLIENAERFGLSQLHQLRGRVGRSATVLLFTDEQFQTETARQRLKVEQQGWLLRWICAAVPGEVLGTRQSGPDFTLASLVEDQEVLELAREAAEKAARDESLRWPLLQAELKYRYEGLMAVRF